MPSNSNYVFTNFDIKNITWIVLFNKTIAIPLQLQRIAAAAPLLTQVIGMVAIFVTAMWGMWQNLAIAPWGVDIAPVRLVT